LNKTKFGQCGGISFKIPPHQKINSTSMKTGCYDFGAFITGKTETKEFAATCIYDEGHKWTLNISLNGLEMHGP
jgi:hypothetical protein